jgi:DNA-binding MarR family transcriptional regulator
MNDDHPNIQDSLGLMIYRTGLALKSSLQRRFKEHGIEITAEQWVLIRHLWEEEGLSQRQIGEKAAKDKPNITRMLDALEKKRLIRRQPDLRDRRKFCIYLTKEGKQLHDRLLPLTRTFRERITQDLSQPEMDHLKDALTKINRSIGNLETQK